MNPAIKRLGQDALRRLPVIGPVLGRAFEFERFVPLGHFYSPYPPMDELRARDGQMFDTRERALPGIDLNDAGQLALLESISAHARTLELASAQTPDRRYFTDNGYFLETDGRTLAAMLLHIKPRRVFEIGSGFSSALMLDLRDAFPPGPAEFTFLDPNPERLLSVLRESDRQSCRIVRDVVQNTPLADFDRLEPGDLLFIDSSHVSRVGSDVNYLFFEVIPRLKPGVWVHIHDIFYPFEYPREWLMAGRFWTECYLLRALLMNNPTLRVELFPHFLTLHRHDAFARAFPGAAPGSGQSIYLRRV